MMQSNLKQFEKELFQKFHQDGIWDMFLGLITLGFGLNHILYEFKLIDFEKTVLPMSIAAFIAFAAIIVLVFGKKYITIRRLGFVRFSKERVKRTKYSMVVLTISVIVGVLLFVLVFFRILHSESLLGIPYIVLIFSAQVLIVFGLLAFFFNHPRLYIYAFLLAFSFPLMIYLKKNTTFTYPSLVVFSIASLPPLIIGIVLFVRFLKKYPAPEKNENE